MESMTNVSDATLIEHCLQGDKQAFGSIVRRYQHVVYSLILNHVRNFDEANDLVQETFISAYFHLGDIDMTQSSQLGSWLKRIATNLCQDYHRKLKAEQTALAELRSNSESAYRGSSSEVLAKKEIGEQVLKAINQLSEEHRQVILLYYKDDLTSQEIAILLGITTDVVDQRLHRAREELKEEMLLMIKHILREHRTDEAFVQQIVEKALARAREAHKQYSHSKAVRYCNELLYAMDDLDTRRAYRKLKADTFLERGAALYSLYENGQRSLDDWEVALEIEKEVEDKKSYAQNLIDTGSRYLSTGDSEHGLECYEEAITIFRALRDEKRLAKALYCIGMQQVMAFLDKKGAKLHVALDYFEESLKVARKIQDPLQIVLSHNAIESLKQVGAKVDWVSIHAYGTTCFVMERSSSSLTWLEQPGFEWFLPRESTQSMLHCAWGYMFDPRRMLKVPIHTGDRWTAPALVFGHEKMTATSTVGSMNEVVCVPVGKFEECVKLSTVFERSGYEESAYFRELNAHLAGTRLIWFAPGVGPVRMEYHHQDGATTVAELTDVKVGRTSKNYFPLQIGNRWQYEGRNDQTDKVLFDTYWTAAQGGGTYYIAQFAYVP